MTTQKEYTVRVYETIETTLTITAESYDDALQKSQQVVRDEPERLNSISEYDYHVYEPFENPHRLVFTSTKRDDIDSLITDINHLGYSEGDYYVDEL